MARTLTTANSIITIAQPILFPIPQQMQGFAADDVFDIDQVKTIEAVMGVDGILSFGFMWVERTQNIALQADSALNDFFDLVAMQQEAAQDVYPFSGVVILPAIKTKYTMINGGLTGYKPAPDAKKTLQPRKYQITWNRIIPSPTL